jgi:outer membrane protein OmpA-like peptidoglycan-associated protein
LQSQPKRRISKIFSQAKKKKIKHANTRATRTDKENETQFDKFNMTVKFDNATMLNKLAAILQEYPDTDVLVVGHTDSTGSSTSNMTLSENRAKAVSNYFINSKGLSSSRFTISWFGEDQPIADNNTIDGREKNRRVNIVIVPNKKMIEDANKEAGKN